MLIFAFLIFFVMFLAAVSFVGMASRSAVKSVRQVMAHPSGGQRQAIGAAMAPVKALREQVVNGITYADTYLDLLPASEHKTAALLARQEAARQLEMAGKLAPAARTPQDFARMEAVLQQASDEAEKSRREIDLATGGTGVAVGISGTDYHATPATANGVAFQSAPVQTDMDASLIPENERGVCFFCSRPSRVSELTAVNFVVNGQRRKVLACADDARTIQQGAAPQIQSVDENGQRVPWFRAANYNPYRDYGRMAGASNSGGNFAHAPGGFGATGGVSHGIAQSSAHPAPPPLPGYYGGGYDYGYGYNWYSDAIFLNLLLAPEPVPYPVYIDAGGYMTDNPALALAPPMENFNSPYDAGGGFDFNTPGYDAAGNVAADHSGWDAFDQLDANLANYDVNAPGDFGDFGNVDFDPTDAGNATDWGGSSDTGQSYDSGSSFDSGSSYDSGGGFDSGGDSGGGGGDS